MSKQLPRITFLARIVLDSKINLLMPLLGRLAVAVVLLVSVGSLDVSVETSPKVNPLNRPVRVCTVLDDGFLMPSDGSECQSQCNGDSCCTPRLTLTHSQSLCLDVPHRSVCRLAHDTEDLFPLNYSRKLAGFRGRRFRSGVQEHTWMGLRSARLCNLRRGFLPHTCR